MSKLKPSASTTRVRPPTAASRSNMVTRTPAAAKSIAAASPPGPAPTMATLRGGEAPPGRTLILAWLVVGEASKRVARRLDGSWTIARIGAPPVEGQALGPGRLCKCAGPLHRSRRQAIVAGARQGGGLGPVPFTGAGRCTRTE